MRGLIVTIVDEMNYGNRLQNYALMVKVNQYFECVTLNNIFMFSKKRRFVSKFRNLSRFICKAASIVVKGGIKLKFIRIGNFLDFENNIKFKNSSRKKLSRLNYDCLISGSDQLWNFNFKSNDMNINMLKAFGENKTKISYAASLGMKELSPEQQEIIRNNLADFNAIAVRENDAKELIQPLVDKPVEVVLDPVLLLPAEEWDKVSKKPKWHNENKKYILQYFLGEETAEFKQKVSELQQKYDFEVIDIYDNTSKYFACGPSEFVWLIKNSSCVITDSFHAVAFSILYQKPLAILTGAGNRGDMIGRFDTLRQNLALPIEFNKIEVDNIMNIDYTGVNNKLNEWRLKSNNYLERAFNKEQ